MYSDSRIYFFPLRPISVNDAYMRARWGGRDRFLTNDARIFKEKIKELLELQDNHLYSSDKLQLDNKTYLALNFYFYFKKDTLYMGKTITEDSCLSANDVSNFFKLIEDAFSEYSKIDDRNNLIIRGTKALSSDLSPEIDSNFFFLTIDKIDSFPSVPKDLNIKFVNLLKLFKNYNEL